MPKVINKNYFDENKIIQIIDKYNDTKDVQVLSELLAPLTTQIHKMIGKEFAYNSVIQNNKDDAVSNCFIEILKSIPRFSDKKGKAFSYINRIIKNTLLKYTIYLRKHQSILHYDDFVENEESDTFISYLDFSQPKSFKNCIIKTHNVSNNKYTDKCNQDLLYIYYVYSGVLSKIKTALSSSLLLENLYANIIYSDYDLECDIDQLKKLLYILEKGITDILNWIEKNEDINKNIIINRSDSNLHITRKFKKMLSDLKISILPTVSEQDKYNISILLTFFLGGE